MAHPVMIALSLVACYGLLAAGYLARRRRPELLEWSPRCFRFTLLCVDGPLMAVTLWLLSPEARAGAWQLPLVGLVASTLLIGGGLAAARLQGLKRAEEGAFVCGSAMSNIGYSFGGLACLMMFGLDGLTLSQVYTIYLAPFTFLVMFQVAAWYASREAAATVRAMAVRFMKDPARWLPVAAILVGAVLNKFAPRPPEWVRAVVPFWVLCATGVYSFGIGTSVLLGKLRGHVTACLTLSAVKFLISPLLALALASLFHLTVLQRQVVFVESAMPMAIYALVLTGLTGLSRDLANSCWMFTTLIALPLTLPLYFIAARFLVP